MTQHDKGGLDTELQTLRNIAPHRPVIEQAKGMVRLLRSCGDEQAFTVLREISQNTNVKLHDVATIIVATGSGTPPRPDDHVARAVPTDVRCTGLSGPFAASVTSG